MSEAKQVDQSETSSPPLPKWVASQVSVLAQGLGLFGALVYVLGYIVVNTYFSPYGIASKGLLNAAYLPAGVILVLILSLFIVFVGMRIYRMDATGKNITNAKPSWVAGFIWWVFVLIWLVAGIVFSITATAALVMITLLRESTSWLSAPLLVYFLIDYQLLFFRVYRRFPASGLFLSMVGYVSTVWLAASRAHDPVFPFLFWSLCGLAVTLLLLFEVDRMYGPNKISRTIAGLGILVGIALFFGEKVYGKIPQSLGGGKPTTVQLLISTQNLSAVRSVLKVDASLTEPVQLLGEDSDQIVLLITALDGSEHPFRLSKRLIDGILPKSKVSVVSTPAKTEASPPTPSLP